MELVGAGAVTRRGKKKRMLTPMTFSLIHATDFADRTEQHIIPPLKAGHRREPLDRRATGSDAADCDQGADRRQEEQDSPMGRFEFYGQGVPAVDTHDLKGTLVVVEGADGVGRSGLLKEWLESRGHAVLDTGMTRSALTGRGLKAAKEGHTLGALTMSLFYATDFADRGGRSALRAGVPHHRWRLAPVLSEPHGPGGPSERDRRVDIELRADSA
jgi:hypothetical protein